MVIAESSQALPSEHEVVAGRYELQRRLARGGMGEVFSALDRSTGNTVALKRLRHSALQQRSIVSDFMREYHALSLLRHPRIIEVYDYGVDHEQPYYTMELLDGQDLSELSPLPYREACFYLRDVASSLALLHARRLLHRDVSPRNVRRTSDGRCKLIDFGAMIAFGVPPNVTGTAPCIAPEALQGAMLDQRTDLYSLGALAYRVFTGHHAYDVSDLDELPDAWKASPLRPRRIVSELPEVLDDLVMSLLSLDPMKRPSSAAEVIDWLSAIGQLAVEDTASAARSFLTTSRLCGRESARKLLTRNLESAIGGHGATILVEGPAGSGKTRILEEAVLIAQTCGLTAVRAVARAQHGAGYSLARDLVLTMRQMLPQEAASTRAEPFEWERSSWPPHGLTGSKPLANSRDAAEQRTRSQQTLTDLFCRVARARPLLITVDDLDRADEFSTAFIAALAHQARGLPLVIVASRTEGHSERYPSAGLALAEIASHAHLADLDRAQSAELVESMFGRVPNVERLSAWMFRVAHGSPKLTVALAEHLLSRDVVRYVAGTWVLPSDEIVESVPPDLMQALGLRLTGLSPDAVALAELLSVRRGGATTELCLKVAARPAVEVFAAIDELVGNGVLESAGREYGFAQEEIRNILRRALTPERMRELHRRWANELLAESAPDLDIQLEAGWHLVHTDDELRGADLLAEVAPQLVEHGLAMATALPAIEAALAIYERHARPLQARLRLRSTLVLAGYLFDYRLAARYGEDTLAVLYELSGMALAQRLSRYVGARLGFTLGLGLTALRRLWPGRVHSDPPVITALQYFIRTAMGLMGVRAVALDVQGTAAVLDKVRPLAGSPGFSSGLVVYRTCQAIVLQMLGREAELDQALKSALHLLRIDRGRYMTDTERQALLVGLLTSDGINECYRENSQALQRADALGEIGTCLAQTAAHRIRLIHALTRAELERAEQSRRLIDLYGIQGGTTWQVEWFAAPIEGMLGGAAWADLVLLRRSLERLRRLSDDLPSFRPHLHSIQIAYHFRRAEFALAAELGERFVAEHLPRTIVGWGPTYAITALALIEAGHAERARVLCERALEVVSGADRAYIIMYGQLEVALATALAVLGVPQRANEILRSRVERLEACGDHAGLVALHQDRARIARLLKDRSALNSALQSMRQEALAAGSAALVLLADRTAELRAQHIYSPLPDRTGEAQHTTARSSTQQERAVTRFLRGCRSATDRNRQALQMLARFTASDEVYLFSCLDGEVKPIAALDDRNAPEHLTTKIRELMQAEASSSTGGTYEMLVTELTTHGGEPLRFRLILLASDRPGERCVGVAAVRETEAASSDLSGVMLADLCLVLADNVRLQTKRTHSKQPSP
jgi:hypothetical protein